MSGGVAHGGGRTVAGILLTGGASRRMGADKATLVVAGVTGPGQATMAERTAQLLLAVAGPCVEVGPGCSGLAAVREDPPGGGPLAALAAGVAWLRRAGWAGPALVVATDLPRLDTTTLVWLATHPAPGSVIPVVDGYPQALCARWSAGDLDGAGRLAAAGRRAMRDLLAATEPLLADPGEAGGPGPGPFADVDTPDEARAHGLRPRGARAQR